MQFKIDYKTINIHTKVGVLPIRIAKSNVSSVGPSSERNSAYAAHYVYFNRDLKIYDAARSTTRSSKC